MVSGGVHLAGVACVAATMENWNDDKSNFIKYRYTSPKQQKTVSSALSVIFLPFIRSVVRGNLNRDPFVAANRMRLQSYLSYHKILVYGIVMLFISSSNVSIQIQPKRTRIHRMMCTIIIVSIDSHVLIYSVCLIGISDVATHSTINTKCNKGSSKTCIQMGQSTV